MNDINHNSNWTRSLLNNKSCSVNCSVNYPARLNVRKTFIHHSLRYKCWYFITPSNRSHTYRQILKTMKYLTHILWDQKTMTLAAFWYVYNVVILHLRSVRLLSYTCCEPGQLRAYDMWTTGFPAKYAAWGVNIALGVCQLNNPSNRWKDNL